jgi:hypothetical protein
MSVQFSGADQVQPNGTAPPRLGFPICQACGGAMMKKTLSSGNCAGLMLALLLLVVGFVILLAIPIVGWVVGPLLMLLALFMGGKRQKVWRCRSCKGIVPRVYLWIQFKGKTTMKKRIIMRIEIMPMARDGLYDTVERTGSTNVSVLTRLIVWFATQPEMLQAQILGLLPQDEKDKTATDAMRKLKDRWN